MSQLFKKWSENEQKTVDKLSIKPSSQTFPDRKTLFIKISRFDIYIYINGIFFVSFWGDRKLSVLCIYLTVASSL